MYQQIFQSSSCVCINISNPDVPYLCFTVLRFHSQRECLGIRVIIKSHDMHWASCVKLQWVMLHFVELHEIALNCGSCFQMHCYNIADPAWHCCAELSEKQKVGCLVCGEATTWLDLKIPHDWPNLKLARVQAGWPKYLSGRMPIFSKSQMNREAGSRGLPHRPIGTLANFGASCKYDTWGCLNPATFHQTTSKQCRTTGILKKKKLYKREFSWIYAD